MQAVVRSLHMTIAANSDRRLAVIELLKTERETYEAHRHALLSEHLGEYVLIKGSEIVALFESRKDAVRRGYETFGNVPFLIKRIELVETPIQFFTDRIGI